MIEDISCVKVKLGNKEYIRIENEPPIWFVWSEIRSEYETSYKSEELEKQYLELPRD